MFNPHNGQSGFALVQVLISLLIIQVTLFTLLYAVSTASEAKNLNTHSIVAYRLMESTMEKTLGDIKGATISGDYKNSSVVESYTVSVNANPVTTSLSKVIVQVDFKLKKVVGGEKSYSYTLESLVALP